jgi:hypothetical protein
MKEWIVEEVKCDLCAHEWIAVHHIKSEKLECPNCENLAYFESTDAGFA